MASIERRGDYQYRCKVSKKGYPPVSKTFTFRKDAEAWGREIEAQMERGAYFPSKDAENTTLAEALDRYAKEITVNKKGSVQELGRINLWKNHPLSQRLLATLRGMDFAQYRDERQAAGKSPNTIRLELAVISHLFTIARKEWGMESLANPVQAIRLPSPGQARDRRLQPGEEEKLLEVARASKSRAIEQIIVIALETAARRGEIFAMRWEHLDLAKRTWHIPHTKNGTPRTIPLSTRAAETLRSLPRRFDGRVWDLQREDGITLAFDRLCKLRLKEDGKTKVVVRFPDLRFHDLRHEATSRLFEKGLNIMEVAAVTGHKDLKMLQRYTYLRAEDLAAKLG